MVLIKEYRIPMPLALEEYRIAQLYMVSKVSVNESGNGEGIEVLKNEPYEDANGKGQYTLKLYNFASRVPGWVAAVLPTSMLSATEESWNSFPYSRTVYKNSWMGDRFRLELITRYCPDAGTQENVHNLDEETLKQRQLEWIDIAKDAVDPSKYKPEEDPTKFVSKKTGRGPLALDWIEKHPNPVMCSYKLCYIEFRYWGLQTKTESLLNRVALRDVLTLSHKQCVCWMDEWWGMSMDDIRRFEEQAKLQMLVRLGKAAPPLAVEERKGKEPAEDDENDSNQTSTSSTSPTSSGH